MNAQRTTQIANQLSDMMALMISSHAAPHTKDAPIKQTEEKAVGIYLLLEDELHGQVVLTLPQDSAPNIVDFMLEKQPGTCVYLGDVA